MNPQLQLETSILLFQQLANDLVRKSASTWKNRTIPSMIMDWKTLDSKNVKSLQIEMWVFKAIPIKIPARYFGRYIDRIIINFYGKAKKNS